MYRIPLFLLFVLLWIFTPGLCRAEDKFFSSPELTVSGERFKSGSDVLAVFHLKFQPAWHAYAHDEKQGKPTNLSFTGLSLSDMTRVEIFYPRGEAETDVLDPKRKVFVYTGTTDIFVRLKEGLKAKNLNAGIDLLLCSAQSCMPLKMEFVVPAPMSGDLSDLATRPDIQNAWKKALPGTSPELKTTKIPTPAPEELKLTPRFYNSRLEVSALGKAMFLGLLAGFLLNVMPCVLPVITLKASALLIVSAQKDQAHKASVMRRYSLFFALGILSFFMFLALLAGVAGQMWGQSFQNPEAVHGMAALVVLLGASLFGAFTLPIIDLKAVSGFSASQAYFTGLFTTLLATPCSGPLLGGVLGWSFTQPGLSRAVVFAAIGLGMALPHFFMACRPGVAVLLPRPGPWMGVVEKMVGFFSAGSGALSCFHSSFCHAYAGTGRNSAHGAGLLDLGAFWRFALAHQRTTPGHGPFGRMHNCRGRAAALSWGNVHATVGEF